MAKSKGKTKKFTKNQFQPGNQIWKTRSKHGRDTIFATPEKLWEAACEYFIWAENNPLISTEAKVTSSGNGEGSKVEMIEVPKMRAFSLKGLCIFLGVTSSYFRAFKLTQSESKPDFITIIELIEDIIYNQKFEGAAAGMLKENLIARELGLKDKTDITTDGDKIVPNNVVNLSTVPTELLQELKKHMSE